MKVQKINWIDESAQEAIVSITDGKFVCEAFCCPCKLRIEDSLARPLKALSEGRIVKVDERAPSVIKTHEWSYEIVGVITDVAKSLVMVGRLEIILWSMPGDLKNGDMVLCYPSRLDIMD